MRSCVWFAVIPTFELIFLSLVVLNGVFIELLFVVFVGTYVWFAIVMYAQNLVWLSMLIVVIKKKCDC